MIDRIAQSKTITIIIIFYNIKDLNFVLQDPHAYIKVSVPNRKKSVPTLLGRARPYATGTGSETFIYACRSCIILSKINIT